MKKLGKLKLHDSVVMSDSELKHVFGGMEPTTKPGGTGTPADSNPCVDIHSEAACSGSCNKGEKPGSCGWRVIEGKGMCLCRLST